MYNATARRAFADEAVELERHLGIVASAVIAALNGFIALALAVTIAFPST
jgi:hypothetical protein